MKTILMFFFACLLCYAGLAQSPTLKLSIAPDTSYLLFGGVPKLSVTKFRTANNVHFQMNRRDFKSLLEITSFLQASREVSLQSVATYESLVTKRDSAISVLKAKYETEAQRTENFRSGYEELKTVNQATQTQLRACIDDLQKLNHQRKKGRWAFTKGVVLGLAIGSVGGILIGAAL